MYQHREGRISDSALHRLECGYDQYEIQPRVMIKNFGELVIITCTAWSKIKNCNALSADTGDHMHYKLLCTFPSHMHSSVSRNQTECNSGQTLHAGDIQSWGGSGLVHKTNMLSYTIVSRANAHSRVSAHIPHFKGSM